MIQFSIQRTGTCTFQAILMQSHAHIHLLSVCTAWLNRISAVGIVHIRTLCNTLNQHLYYNKSLTCGLEFVDIKICFNFLLSISAPVESTSYTSLNAASLTSIAIHSIPFHFDPLHAWAASTIWTLEAQQPSSLGGISRCAHTYARSHTLYSLVVVVDGTRLQHVSSVER